MKHLGLPQVVMIPELHLESLEDLRSSLITLSTSAYSNQISGKFHTASF